MDELERLRADNERLRADNGRLLAEGERYAERLGRAEAERDRLLEGCVEEIQYRLCPRGETRHGWRWGVGEETGISETRDAAVAAVRAAVGLDREGLTP